MFSGTSSTLKENLLDDIDSDSDIMKQVNGDLNKKDLSNKNIHRQEIKKYYQDKLSWEWLTNLILIAAICTIVGLAIYIVILTQAYKCQNCSNPYTINYDRTLQSKPYTNTSTFATFRIYNQATSVISNQEIMDGMMQALHLQIQEEVKDIWGVSGEVLFNSTYNNQVQDDGSWPIFIINSAPDPGLGYHTISIGGGNPSYAQSVPINIPYAVIQIPVICTGSVTHDQCLATTTVVMSHEILETLLDTYATTNIWWATLATNIQTKIDELFVFHEIADPAQGQIYIKANYTKYPVHNFVTPLWFQQLAAIDGNPNNLYDYLGLLSQPGETSPAGYIIYSNMTDGCNYYYLPDSGNYGQHNRVVQSCGYRRCSCPYSVGTIVGSDPIGHSFGNVYASYNPVLLVDVIMGNFISVRK